MKKKIDDNEFIALWNKCRSPKAVSEACGLDIRQVYKRRREIERDHRVSLSVSQGAIEVSGVSGRVQTELRDGVVLVFSDAHYWPGEPSTAHRALLLFCEQFHPEIVVCNGDAFDGVKVSRFPTREWGHAPSVKEEIDAVKERLGEIETICKGRLVWTLGNHDGRYETHLIATAGTAFEGVEGFSLKDHFPRWLPAYSLFVNDDVVIKHRAKGGMHAPFNNTREFGRTLVTGHLHSQKVMPHTDYNGTRWGVDTGCLADPSGRQFAYCEDSGNNQWRSGFAVLTFRDGRLLPPELVTVWDEDSGQVTFRGAVINV